MPSYAHRKTAEELLRLEALKNEQPEKWLTGDFHMEFLTGQFKNQEIILYGSTKHLFVHTVLAPLPKVNEQELRQCMNWSFNPYRARVHQVTSYKNGAKTTSVSECMEDENGNFRNGKQIVFNRFFDGDKEGLNWEVLQELLHLLDLFHLPSRSAFCRLDKNGDYEDVISYSEDDGLNLVTMHRGALDWFADSIKQSIIQTFDTNLYLSLDFFHNPKYEVSNIYRDNLLFDHGIAAGEATYMRGVFAETPNLSEKSFVPAYLFVADDEEAAKSNITFLLHDWRHGKICEVSAATDATTNYFDRTEGLPFDVSPAFFRPDVLQKYKTDAEKYTIEGRTISCRGAWYLKSFDINKAGQVSAYIYDLRKLPVSELKHWQSYNEEPKAGLSERAIQNDFKGEFFTEIDPLNELKALFGRWNETSVSFWKLRDVSLLKSLSYPFSENRDEWARDLDSLHKVCIEGYAVRPIREAIRDRNLDYDNQMKSLALLNIMGVDTDPEFSLEYHRSLAHFRNKLTGHNNPKEARELGRTAVSEFGGFRQHFENLCQGLLSECKEVELLFS